jgi:phage host-nuclease inhibitor protein Gam
MEFLTDQQPKLFRGMAEETMIVYLSNVSFTPNKQLSREVWDFSCTVTEICEYNRDNLVKYGLLSERLYTTSYILKMMRKETVDNNGVINVTDYVPLSETIDNIPILRTFWTESKHKGFDDKI